MILGNLSPPTAGGRAQGPTATGTVTQAAIGWPAARAGRKTHWRTAASAASTRLGSYATGRGSPASR